MPAPPIQSWLELPDGQRVDLVGTITIGRSPDNILVLTDDQISRRHAIIQAQGEMEFWLVDLGSANGSYINGRRISQPVQLHAGDVIQFSAVRIEFHSESLSSAHPVGKQMMASTMLSIKQAHCWLMIADIEGSTILAQQLPPEELPRVTGSWFKACRMVIEECGGNMSKYLGDGFFCYWNDGPDSRTQIPSVMEKLQEMQATAAPPFRIVLHYGPVVVGSVPTMAEVNLHGPEVNFAFRMEKIAGSLGERFLLSERANAKLGGERRLAAQSEVDGFRGKYPFYAPA
jgi:adenylate cyclase